MNASEDGDAVVASGIALTKAGMIGHDMKGKNPIHAQVQPFANF